jgi:hypothetical protein
LSSIIDEMKYWLERMYILLMLQLSAFTSVLADLDYSCLENAEALYGNSTAIPAFGNTNS